MIIEGIFTTRNADGTVHISAMGARVATDWQRFVLRPFEATCTWKNLQREPFGVFHVTDDVELLVRAALGLFESLPACEPARCVPGFVLPETCRWYELRGAAVMATGERAEWQGDVLHVGWVRDFCGWNRAQFAVIEATIAATRLHLLPLEEILQDMQKWQGIVGKTGGPTEEKALQIVWAYIASWLSRQRAASEDQTR